MVNDAVFGIFRSRKTWEKKDSNDNIMNSGNKKRMHGRPKKNATILSIILDDKQPKEAEAVYIVAVFPLAS